MAAAPRASFSTAGWPAALPGMRRLEIHCPARLLLGGQPGIMQLTGLQELEVSASVMELGAEDELPLGLTQLEWEGDVRILPPMQFTALFALQSLTLRGCNYDASFGPELADSYPTTVGDLPAATRRHACFDDAELPRTVSVLTRLEALHFCCPESQRDAALPDQLAAVLPSLRRLTALALFGVPSSRQVLQTLASLPRLERLAYCDTVSAEQVPLGLPVGPWLGRLTLLGLESSVLVLNPHLVSGATQLRTLALMGPCWEGLLPRHLLSMSRAGAVRLLHSAASLRHIRSVELHPSWGLVAGHVGPSSGVLHHLLLAEGLQQELQLQRPQLRRCIVPRPGSQEAPNLKQLTAQLFGPEWA